MYSLVGVCIPNQTLRPGTAHKSRRDTFNFCKRYLEINNKASNIACIAELGRFPLNITVNQKRLKYILYIQSKDEESLVKQAFLMSFDLHCNGKNSFHSHLMNMSEYFKLPDFNPDLLDIAYCKKLCKFHETGSHIGKTPFNILKT